MAEIQRELEAHLEEVQVLHSKMQSGEERVLCWRRRLEELEAGVKAKGLDLDVSERRVMKLEQLLTLLYT